MSPLLLGLLHERDYRNLFLATTVSQFGFRIVQLGIPLVAIVTLGASPLQMGLLAAMTTAPFLLVGLPAGVWVDRLRRRTILIVSDIARAMVLVTIPLAQWADLLTLWHLYTVAFVTGTLTVFFDVAYQSYLPHLVGRERLVEGNSKLEIVRSTAHLGGPALGGQLIKLLTAPAALSVTALALVASASLVLGIRSREERPTRRPEARLWSEIAEGLGFVLRQPLLRPIAMCTSTFNLFFAMYGAMLILFLERVLGQDPGVIGLVFTIGGAGGLAGALLSKRLSALLGQGPVIWLSTACTAPFALLMPLLAQPGWRLWVAAAGGFMVSVGLVIYNVTQVSFRQALTPDQLLGRMNATMRFLVWGTLPLGALLGGLLAELIGIRTALLIAGLGICVAFLPVFASPLRTMRNLPVLPDKEPFSS